MHGRTEARQTAADSPEGETNEVSESITPAANRTPHPTPLTCLRLPPPRASRVMGCCGQSGWCPNRDGIDLFLIANHLIFFSLQMWTYYALFVSAVGWRRVGYRAPSAECEPQPTSLTQGEEDEVGGEGLDGE
mgnify:CR=1 FL=1